NPMQAFDQQIASARNVADERADFVERNRIDAAAFRTRAQAAPAAEPRNVDCNDIGLCHAIADQSRKSQYFSTYAARSSECWRTSRSASSVSRRSSASMIRM